MNKVIITGCAGFIGSNLTMLMLEQGYTVLGIDNFHSYYPKEIKEEKLKTLRGFSKFNFIESDIINLNFKDFLDFEWDICIHLAGTPGVLHSVKFPEDYEKNNVKATKSLLSFLNKIGVKKLIFSLFNLFIPLIGSTDDILLLTSLKTILAPIPVKLFFGPMSLI